MKNDKIQINI